MIDAYDILGLLGVVFNLYAYARVQLKREYVKTMNYSLVNLLGALFLCISLLNKWNPASFTGNLIWCFISLYGIYRCSKYLRPANKPADAE